MSQWYKQQGFEVKDRGKLDPQNPPCLVILRTWDEMSSEELLEAFGACALAEQLGIRVVNPLSSHLLMRDKTASHLAFREAGLPYPEEIAPGEAKEFPLVVKPRYGCQGKGVTIVRNRDEMQAALRDLHQPIVQRFAEGKTVRVVATCHQALYAYSKEGDGPVASISQGAEPVRIDPIPGDIAELACRAVKAVGGVIAGVDIILSEEPVLLEINASFRVPQEIDGALGRICQEMLP